MPRILTGFSRGNMSTATLTTRHVLRLNTRWRLSNGVPPTQVARRCVSKEANQTYPISPESNYASTLKNLNIRSNAKTVVVGSSQKLDAISQFGTNVVGFVDESSSDLSSSIQNVLKDALPWVLYISTKEASPVLQALRSATEVQVPLVVCSTTDFEESEMDQLREILSQSAMTRLLGPGASVFAAPHSGFAVWDKAIDGFKTGTIGIVGSGYDAIVKAVQAIQAYGQSAVFDLGNNERAGTRPCEVAEWLFSDDGTEILLVLGNGIPDMEAEVAAAYKAYADRTPDNQRRKRMIGVIGGESKIPWKDAGILVASDISEAASLVKQETERLEAKREEVAQTTKQDPEKVPITDLEP